MAADPVNDIILHHYAGSPFSEKVRLVLGYKGLAWKSVDVPVIMPKPDVLALTGGYRRTPFMQIGADIYCDSALMCRVIDRLAPQPPLVPAATAGFAEIVAQWADSALFWAAIPFTLRPVGLPYIFPGAAPEFIKAFGADRGAMTAGMRRPPAADAGVQLRSYVEWLAGPLADGRSFLLGNEPCIADFAVVHSIWFIRRAPPVAELLDPFPRLTEWTERMAAFGHGNPAAMSSADAIQVAAASTSHAPTSIGAAQPFGAGDLVGVTPTDYAADEVTGRLVGLTVDEVVIERDDARAGRLHVHFPRIGFQVKAASAAAQKAT